MFAPGGPTFLELVEQALSSTDRGYDLLAPKFERTPFRTPDALIEQTLHAALGDRRFAVGLDVCCGTGAALAVLARRCDRVVGVDRSAGMLLEARARVPAAELIQGDALEMARDPRLAGRFDVATSFGAFGHIEERDEPAFVAAVHAALRPGGVFVAATAPPPPVWSRAYLLSRAFNAAMRVRNALWSPPFVMYYLTFLLPRARRLLEDAGFLVDVIDPHFPAPFERYVVVRAAKT